MLSSTTLKIPVAAEPSLAGVPIIVSKSETLVFNVYNDAGILEARSYEDMVLTANQPRYVLSVPVEALDNNYDTGNVYVINSNNELEERHVTVGAVGEKYAEILSGLQEGDIVVVSGIDGLKEGQKVEANMEEGEE